MQTLIDRLLQRWEQAFDEIETLPAHKAEVITTQYAEGHRYNLQKFDWASFPSDGPMKNEMTELDPRFTHDYGFNARGLPCYTASYHFENKAAWQGFYTYTDTLVEYVEFCINTGIPNRLDRIRFHEGKKVSFQSLTINAAGNAPIWSLSTHSKADVISTIRNDQYAIISTVTSFDYASTGKIQRSSSVHLAPGIGKYTSHDEYTYDEKQNLDTIRTFFERGSNRLKYVRLPEDMTPESLVEKLSAAMAGSILTTLVAHGPTEPINLLELSYRYADSYMPFLSFRSAQEIADELATQQFLFTSASMASLQLDSRPFEKLFAQLEQMIEERDETQLGCTMLRRTARILTTTKLEGKLPVTKDFAAYALDGSIEGHSIEDMEEILTECGVQPAVIETWKQSGMLS